MYKVFVISVLIFGVFYFNFVYADEFTSSSFKILDPVITIGGGRSTSDSFQLERSVGQPAIGLSDSSSFELRGGFLYFPAPAAAPTPAPTPAPAPTPQDGGAPGAFQPILPFLPGIPTVILPALPIPVKKCDIADFNCDGVIDLADLSVFFYLGSYTPFGNPGDLNGDGVIDLADTSVLFSVWSDRGAARVPAFGETPALHREAAPSFGGPFIIHGPQPAAPGLGIQKEQTVPAEEKLLAAVLRPIREAAFAAKEAVKEAAREVVNAAVRFLGGVLRFLLDVVNPVTR